MENKENTKGVIIYYGEYPTNDSWANRIKNTLKIFDSLSISCSVLVPYPPLLIENERNLNDKTIRLERIKKEKNSFFSQVYFYLKGVFDSYRFIKKQSNLDFVFFAGGSFLTCYPIIKLCKSKNIKIWIDIVDENSKKFEQTKTIRDYIAIFNKDLFDKWLIPKFDKILVISDYLHHKYSKNILLNRLQKSTPTLIDINQYDQNASKNITNNTNEFNQIVSDKRLKLMYAGSIARPNGVFFAMQCAAELIQKQNYNFLIVIIALMGETKKIIDYAKELNIADNLIFLNKQQQDDMPAIYQLNDILFLPEHGSIIANAGFPGKTAELLASGKPVIATNFSDLTLYLKNGVNAMISEIDDKQTYTQNLKKLLDSIELRKQIGVEGRKTAIKHFDFRKNAFIYNELVVN